MKTTMKMMAVMAVMMGFAFSAMGQTHNAQIQANATVVDAISVEVGRNLQFGQVTTGINKSVTVAGVASNESGATSPTGVQSGQFIVYAGVNSTVTLAFTLPSEGKLTNGSNFITMTHGATDAAYGTVADGSSVTGSATPSAGFSFTGNFPNNAITVGENTKNGIYVFLGGTVAPGAAPIGTYAANVTLTATYN